MKNRLWFLVPTLCLTALCVIWPSKGVSADKPKAEHDQAFKVLMIYCKDPTKSTVLGDVRVRRLGGRTFLAGKSLSRDGSESPWSKGTHWIPIEEVAEMFEFSTVEDARKAQAFAEEHRATKP